MARCLMSIQASLVLAVICTIVFQGTRVVLIAVAAVAYAPHPHEFESLQLRTASINVYQRLGASVDYVLIARLSFPGCVKSPATIINAGEGPRGRFKRQQAPSSKWAISGKLIDQDSQRTLLSCESKDELRLFNFTFKYALNTYVYGGAYIVAVRPSLVDSGLPPPARVAWSDDAPFRMGDSDIVLVDGDCEAFFTSAKSDEYVDRVRLIDEEVELGLEVIHFTTRDYTVALFCDVSGFAYGGKRKSLDYVVLHGDAATRLRDQNDYWMQHTWQSNNFSDVAISPSEIRSRDLKSFEVAVARVRHSRASQSAPAEL